MTHTDSVNETIELDLSEEQRVLLVSALIQSTFCPASVELWDSLKNNSESFQDNLVHVIINESVNTILLDAVKGKSINTDPSWDNIQSFVDDIAGMVWAMPHKPTKILGVSRGGLILAVCLSHKLDIPMVPVSYSSKAGNGDDKNHSNILPVFEVTDRVLIVDDIADSGLTIRELSDHYKSRVDTVHTACIYYKESSIIEPDIYAVKIPKDAPFINFPWERS